VVRRRIDVPAARHDDRLGRRIRAQRLGGHGRDPAAGRTRAGRGLAGGRGRPARRQVDRRAHRRGVRRWLRAGRGAPRRPSRRTAAAGLRSGGRP
jgi:hypothetical protein